MNIEYFSINRTVKRLNYPVDRIEIEFFDNDSREDKTLTVDAFMARFESPGDERLIGITGHGWYATRDHRSFERVAPASATQGEATSAAMKLVTR